MRAGTLKMLDWKPRLKRWKQTVKQSSSRKVWIILKASDCVLKSLFYHVFESAFNAPKIPYDDF